MKEFRNMTRLTFIKVAAFVSVSVLTGFSFIKKGFAGAGNYVAARTNGVYTQDQKMQYRKSQDNPMIKEIYKSFLHEPNSHEAHHLLHTEYVDRSAKVAAAKNRGIEVRL